MSVYTNISLNDFNNICRTCSAKGELIPLFENNYLIEMLQTCTQVQFDLNDELPTHICSECIKELNQAYLFSNKCKSIDLVLRTCITIENSKRSSIDKNIQTKPGLNVAKSTHSEEIVHSSEIENINLTINLEDIKQEIDDETIKTEDNNSLSNEIEFDENLSENTESTFESINENNTNTQNSLKMKEIFVKNQTVRREIEIVSKQKSLYSTSNMNYFNNKLNFNRKSHACKICDKKFNELSNYRKHLRVHSGEKPFVCNVCLKSFSQSSNLNKHIKIHLKQNCVIDNSN